MGWRAILAIATAAVFWQAAAVTVAAVEDQIERGALEW